MHATVWSDLDRPLQDDLLWLMEHFDLSYGIPDDPEDRSLVAERLALDPAPYEEQWDSMSPESGCREIRMKFDPQSTRPAGIPGWFIARSHRFTTHTHWKYGALFQDDRREGQRRHLALLHSSPTGGEYTIDEPAKWASTLAPHVGRLVKVFKYAAPLVAPGLGWPLNDLLQHLVTTPRHIVALSY